MRSHTSETCNRSASPGEQRRESYVSAKKHKVWGVGVGGGAGKKTNLMAMNQTGVQGRNPSGGMCGV